MLVSGIQYSIRNQNCKRGGRKKRCYSVIFFLANTWRLSLHTLSHFQRQIQIIIISVSFPCDSRASVHVLVILLPYILEHCYMCCFVPYSAGHVLCASYYSAIHFSTLFYVLVSYSEAWFYVLVIFLRYILLVSYYAPHGCYLLALSTRVLPFRPLLSTWQPMSSGHCHLNLLCTLDTRAAELSQFAQAIALAQSLDANEISPHACIHRRLRRGKG